MDSRIEKKTHPELYCPYLNCLQKTAEASPNRKAYVLNPGFCSRHRQFSAPIRAGVLAFVVALLLAFSASAQIVREGYDNTGDAANLSETILTPATVGGGTFGKLFTLPVDGSIYAQPLYVPNLSLGGAQHNVVFVATMNDVVYAFDADTSQAALWSKDFRTNGATPVVSSTNNIDGNVGIESTPVIDVTTHTIYVVAYTFESNAAVYRLHALDITTGAEKFGGPAVIGGTYYGGLTFVPALQQQRPGLAESNGTIWIAFGSFGDVGAYNGWVFGYSASTLQPQFIYADEPTGTDGGIWMAGHAPVIDGSGYVYIATGNGTYDGVQNFGESFLKLTTNGIVTDWFTPSDFANLTANDEDLGSAGPILIPGTSLLVGGGKEGILYATSTANLGHEWALNTQIVQQWTPGYVHTSPAYDSQNSTLYIWPSLGKLSAYALNGLMFNIAASSQSTITAQGTGGALAVTPGIVWATLPTTTDLEGGTLSGALYAFQANNLANELWDSNKNASRDSLGTWSKFRAPLVVNGKVYAPSLATSTTAGVLNVYGLSAPSGASGASATFVTTDSSTEGAWSTKYGGDGFTVPNGASSVPSYGAFSTQNLGAYTWAASTADPRAASGAATCWYTTGVNGTLNVNAGSGTHQFALYLLDWDNRGRAEKITIADAASGAVLDTETASNFTNGLYLVWNIHGSVVVTVTWISGPNAVVSGAFFGTGSSSGTGGTGGTGGGSTGGGSTGGGSTGGGTPSIQLCAGATCITVPSGSTITVTD